MRRQFLADLLNFMHSLHFVINYEIQINEICMDMIHFLILTACEPFAMNKALDESNN